MIVKYPIKKKRKTLYLPNKVKKIGLHILLLGIKIYFCTLLKISEDVETETKRSKNTAAV
jgi:hypothetical protein